MYDMVMTDIQRVYPYFADIHARSRRNVNFYANYQWNSHELNAHARQFRIPYVWNKIGQQINNLLGTQLQTKLDVRSSPIEAGDAGVAQLLNKMIKWAEQVNNINKIESEVFKSGILGGIGVTQTSWDFSEFYGGYPRVDRLPSSQLGWDLNSTEIDLSDTRFMFRITPLTRGQALEEYPEYADAIDRADRSYSHAYSIMRDAYTPLQAAYSNGIMMSQKARDLIYMIQHFEKTVQNKYIAVDLIGKTEPIVFEDEREASRYYQGLIDSYMESGEELQDRNGYDNVFVAEVKRELFTQNLVIGNECVASLDTELAKYPWDVYFANYVDGDFWSPADSMISPQRFLNRTVSEWDLQVGRANKQFATVIESKLAKGWDFNKFMTARSQTGAGVPVYSHDAIQFAQNQPAHPDMSKMLSMAQGFMMELAGGPNALGMQENAAESSKAVRARQAAAGLAKMPLYNNLTSWRYGVTENMVWYMKQFLDDSQVLRILGDGGRASFLELDSNLLNTIKESRTDIQIVSTVDSDIAREETREQIKEFAQSMQGVIPGEVLLPIMLELSDIDLDMKEKMLSQIEHYQQWLQQQQQQQMQMKLQERADNQVETEYMREQKRVALQNQSPADPIVQRMQ